VEQEYKGANTVVVKTMDGIRHLFHLTGKTVVHGGESAGAEALRGLGAGSTVVVHYLVDGGEQTAIEVDRLDHEGLKTMEGVVTRVDRAARTISIRLADGSTQTLRLTDRAATDVGKDVDRAAADSTRVVVYYANEAGQHVAHYFKRIS
jgi:thioredoxin reductase